MIAHTSNLIATQQVDPYTALSDRLHKAFPPKVIAAGIGMAILIAVLMYWSSRQKILADARFASWMEIRSGKLKAIKDIKAQTLNKLGVMLGSNFKKALALSNICPGMVAVGKSGCGKTESVCSPVIDDLIRQGKTILVYDIKGDLRKRHAAFAMSQGYKVYSFPEQGVNLLDFMKDSDDQQGAGEISNCIHSNLGGKTSPEDPFFGPQGKAALKTSFMLAKESPYPDLLTAFSFLDLENFASRLDAARQNFHLGTWSGMASTGLKSVAHAPQTSAGIVGSAVLHMQNLLSAQSIPSLLKSEIPLDLDGKVIVFFTVDEQRESASIPIVTAVIEMLVKRNVNGKTKRDKTFCLILDEFASARWPSIDQWVSRFRSYGFFLFLGYQTDSQVRIKYSREEAISILSNLGTKIFFCPNDIFTSETISKLCGDTEVKYKDDKKQTRTVRPLIPAAKIELFDIGEALVFSPGMKNRPYRLRIPLDKSDTARRDSCAKLWEEDLEPQYQAIFNQKRGGNLSLEVTDRRAICDTLLPLPEIYKYMEPEKIEVTV
jgi:type IV secretion system protein VirD4